MLHNEDRELQIRLAELQADVQIFLALGLGFLAAFLALSIMFTQLAFTAPQEDIVTKNVVRALGIVSIIAGALSCRFFVVKALAARRQGAELRKKYVW